MLEALVVAAVIAFSPAGFVQVQGRGAKTVHVKSYRTKGGKHVKSYKRSAR